MQTDLVGCCYWEHRDSRMAPVEGRTRRCIEDPPVRGRRLARLLEEPLSNQSDLAVIQQLYEKVPERLDEIRAYHLIGGAWSRKVREWLMTLPVK